MPRLEILAPYESFEVAQRRGQLYLLTFVAVWLAFQAGAISWDLSQFRQAAYFVAMGASALITGALALVIRRRALALLEARLDIETDRETRESISKLRARRSTRMPAINLQALLPPVDRSPGRQAETKHAPKARQVKTHDPWSKLLDGLTDQPGPKRNQRKKG
jgi:hypothetical protein